jgi:hypothetical protein
MHRDDTRTYPHKDLHGDVAASGESTSRARERELRRLSQSRASQESKRKRGLEQVHDRL